MNDPAIAVPQCAAAATSSRLWLIGRLVLPLVLVIAATLPYRPALKHLPHSDHECFLLETAGHETFFDLVGHTYSWTRTRLFSRGDTQLYRPLLFAWLSGLKAAFGTHWEYCQAVGIALHALICVLLFFLFREILNRGERHVVFEGLAFALALFFALNHAIAEQVIWFHIQPYLVALALLVGASIFLLRATRSETPSRGQRLCLLGAWVTVLLACFFYELGQFFALIAAGFLLLAPWAPLRRKAIAGALFLGIVGLYQTANHVDRGLHRATYEDDLPLSVIARHAMSTDTIENSVRYVLFTVVAPFTRSPIGFLRNGKLFLPEHLWFPGDLQVHTEYPELIRYDIARAPQWTTACWLVVLAGGVFLIVGIARAMRMRDRRVLAGAILLGGVASAQAALVILGRMNFRGRVEPLALNSHYTYSALLWSLALAAVFLAALPRLRARMPLLLGLFALALVALAVDSGGRLYRFNCKLKDAVHEDRACWRSLTDFLDAHQDEPDFSYAVAVNPQGSVPHFSDVPLPYIADNRHVRLEHPKYVLWNNGKTFEALPREQWGRHSPKAPRLYARLVRVGASYHVFERAGVYFAVHLPDQIYPFLYDDQPAENASYFRSASLPAILDWIETHSP